MVYLSDEVVVELLWELDVLVAVVEMEVTVRYLQTCRGEGGVERLWVVVATAQVVAEVSAEQQ